jgi:hypothetical protein
MQWRGLEHYYAGTYRWVHGININGVTSNSAFGAFNYVALNQDRFADSTATNYQFVSFSKTTADGYGGGFNDQAGIFFVPQDGGTASTYTTDRNYGTNGTGWRVLRVGGLSYNGALAGPWYFVANYDPGITFVALGSLLSR